jgi:hypothetical protein
MRLFLFLGAVRFAARVSITPISTGQGAGRRFRQQNHYERLLVSRTPSIINPAGRPHDSATCSLYFM